MPTDVPMKDVVPAVSSLPGELLSDERSSAAIFWRSSTSRPVSSAGSSSA
jgi:hypothetical protein